MSVYSDYVLISNFFYQKSDFCKKIAQNIAVFLKLSKKTTSNLFMFCAFLVLCSHMYEIVYLWILYFQKDNLQTSIKSNFITTWTFNTLLKSPCIYIHLISTEIAIFLSLSFFSLSSIQLKTLTL